MANLADKQPLKTAKFAIGGSAGAGKTELVGTLAKYGKIAIADCDGDGVDTLLGKGFRERYPDISPSNVEYEGFVDKLDDYGIASDPRAYQDMQKWLNKMSKDPSILALVVDSLTSANSLAARLGLKVNKSTNRSKSLTQAQESHVMLRAKQDFGTEMGIIEQMLDAMKTWDKIIVVTFHDKEIRSDDGGLIRIDPIITGQLRGKFAHWFGEVYYLDTVGIGANKKRMLKTESDGLYKFPKTRLGVPDKMENPTFEKIFNSIGGYPNG